MARFLLGFGEAGNFPAAIKTTAQWFPRRERALATGIFNAGSNVGAVLAPLLVPAIALSWGWQAAFVITGLAGLAWIAFWLPLYDHPERHPRVSAAELAWIHSDPPEPATRVPWLGLLSHRQTWAFAVGKFLTDPIWWFYLFWSATFLADRFDMDLKQLGPPLVVIYLLADVGSVAGGWFSSMLLKRGWSANAARKTALLTCAVCVTPVSLAPVVSEAWVAVGLIGLAAAAHQGFSANLFTLTSEVVRVPRKLNVFAAPGQAFRARAPPLRTTTNPSSSAIEVHTRTIRRAVWCCVARAPSTRSDTSVRQSRAQLVDFAYTRL